MATAARPAPGSGSTQMASQAQPTQTITQQAVLHLRGAERGSEDVQGGETRRRIQWAEDVVDNEGMGKKKSKVCCIYHAPKDIDESSDESSSDSSDSDNGDDGSARPTRKEGHNHSHDHGKGSGKGQGKKRSTSPNAYEKVPKPKGSGSKGSS